MFIRLQFPLIPRNQRLLRVLCVCRISGDKQDKLSLKDQEALLKAWVKQRYNGPVEFVVIAGVGSGEALDRKEALQVIQEVATRKFDMVIAEDLGRFYRRIEALILCETCIDEKTRVVAINDHIDTANPNWRMLGLFAVMRHESYNEDTANRIRRTLRNRFTEGGVVQTLIAGYIKPPGTKNDAELLKDPDYEPVYQKWFELLEGGASYSEVADWLNENKIPLGPYCRAKRWDCSMVTRTTNNPLLKGIRQRNKKKSDRVNKSGRHTQINAPPEELLERYCPHLVFIEPARYDRLIAKLKLKNQHFRRKLVDGQDPRANVSKKRTRWPGQHVYCGCCGSMFVYGAHGQTEALICSGAKEYNCWMGMSINGPKAREKLCAAILEQLQQIPEFDSQLLADVRAEAEVQAAVGQQRLTGLKRELQAVDSKLERFAKTIEEYGSSETLMSNLRRLEHEREVLLGEQDEIESRPKAAILAPSASEVRKQIGAALVAVASHDQVAMRLLRALISKITVYPYRSIDGGHPVLRAKFSLNLAALDPTMKDLTAPGHPWHVKMEVDLFDSPKRRAITQKVQQLQADGLSRSQISGQLGVTLPVVQQAINLRKQMDQLGLEDPYEFLTEPPADYSKLRRHLHKRFKSGTDQSDFAA